MRASFLLFSQYHSTVPNVRMLPQYGFDLPQFDAIASQLDLTIASANKFNLPLRCSSPIHRGRSRRRGAGEIARLFAQADAGSLLPALNRRYKALPLLLPAQC